MLLLRNIVHKSVIYYKLIQFVLFIIRSAQSDVYQQIFHKQTNIISW